MNFTRILFFTLLGTLAAWLCGSGLAQQNQSPQTTGGEMRNMPGMGLHGMPTSEMNLELTPPAIAIGQQTQLKFTFIDPQGQRAHHPLSVDFTRCAGRGVGPLGVVGYDTYRTVPSAPVIWGI